MRDFILRVASSKYRELWAILFAILSTGSLYTFGRIRDIPESLSPLIDAHSTATLFFEVSLPLFVAILLGRVLFFLLRAVLSFTPTLSFVNTRSKRMRLFAVQVRNVRRVTTRFQILIQAILVTLLFSFLFLGARQGIIFFLCAIASVIASIFTAYVVVFPRSARSFFDDFVCGCFNFDSFLQYHQKVSTSRNIESVLIFIVFLAFTITTFMTKGKIVAQYSEVIKITYIDGESTDGALTLKSASGVFLWDVNKERMDFIPYSSIRELRCCLGVDS